MNNHDQNLGETGGHDLRSLFHSIGSFSGQRGAMTSPEPRSQTDVPVELLGDRVVAVDAPPLEVEAYVDGVQASLVLTHRDHRPVHLNYTAAAGVTGDIVPIGLRERLEIVMSERDEEWARSLGTTVPISLLPGSDPAETERLAVAALGGARERLERELVDDLLTGSGRLVLDGSLLARPADPRLVGVVKTTRRRYLPDESILWGLPSGSRSPVFRIPGGSQGYEAERFSCYLRLTDATNRGWDFGLIRLETLDPDLLDPLAALCLQQKQPAGSADHRGDRHLRPMHWCEEFLRARRPPVFNL